MKLRIHNHISKKVTPQKSEIAVWPAGKIIKEPEKAAAPEGVTWATTSASYFGQTKLWLAGHYQPWSKLGKKNNNQVWPKTLWPNVFIRPVLGFLNCGTRATSCMQVTYKWYFAMQHVVPGIHSPRNLIISYCHYLTLAFTKVTCQLACGRTDHSWMRSTCRCCAPKET